MAYGIFQVYSYRLFRDVYCVVWFSFCISRGKDSNWNRNGNNSTSNTQADNVSDKDREWSKQFVLILGSLTSSRRYFAFFEFYFI